MRTHSAFLIACSLVTSQLTPCFGVQERFEQNSNLSSWEVIQGKMEISSEEAFEGESSLAILPSEPYGIIQRSLLGLDEGHSLYYRFAVKAVASELEYAESLFDLNGALVALVQEAGEGKVLVFDANSEQGEWLEADFSFAINGAQASQDWLEFTIKENESSWDLYIGDDLYATGLAASIEEGREASFVLYGDNEASTYLDGFQIAPDFPASLAESENLSGKKKREGRSRSGQRSNGRSDRIVSSELASSNAERASLAEARAALLPANKRFIYVDCNVGSDHYEARSALRKGWLSSRAQKRVDRFRTELKDIDGPKRTLKAAMDEAAAGDQIVLFESETPYAYDPLGVEGEVVISPVGDVVLYTPESVIRAMEEKYKKESK